MSNDKKPAADAPATPPAELPKDASPPNDKQGDPAKPAADQKPPENTPKPNEKPPEKYELKARKDSPLLKADLEEIEANAKAKGLSQEDAQKMVDGKEADFDRFNQRQQEAYQAKMAEWRAAAEADKEIAGTDGKAFKENVELAHRGLKMVANDSVMKFLNESGWGNHPDAIKMFMRIGKLFADDKAVLDGKSSPPGKKTSREQKLFPTHFQEKKE